MESAPEPRRPDEDAFQRAIAALAAKERTTGELEELLRGQGHGREETAAAIGRLIEIGELDDERFARRYAEDKRELSGWGTDRIREALAARRLDRETIEVAVRVDREGDELDRAVALLERRGQPAVDERSRGRALGYLARRGYDSETAHAAVRRFEARGAGQAP